MKSVIQLNGTYARLCKCWSRTGRNSAEFICETIKSAFGCCCQIRFLNRDRTPRHWRHTEVCCANVLWFPPTSVVL